MLIHLHREYRNGKSETGGIVLNTKYIYELKVWSSTKARFVYAVQPEDRKGGFETYKVSESFASIKALANTALNAQTIVLAVYKDADDVSKGTENVVFDADSIVKVYPDATDRTRSWMYVSEAGTKLRRYLVNNYYLDIAHIAETGSTTTTSTTSTSTTSTTTTAP